MKNSSNTETKSQKKVLKKSLTGFEVEMFTIDKKGYIKDASDRLLEKAKQDKNLTLKKEISLNMIEIASFPNLKITDTMEHLLQELEYLVSAAGKESILLCPLGAYPGKINPTMRDEPRYNIKKSVLGKARYKIEGRISGFHCHYTLPRGIFDPQLRVLKMLVHSKIKEGFVNSYNMMIAADPAFTCFMQSSPFYQGKYVGKDSRVIMGRGGKALDSPNGLYANFQEFGGLPHYKLTALDIMDIITTRYENWKSHIKSLGLNIKVLSLYGSILYTTWGPVRVTPHGTLEHRGMDMNHPMQIAGAGVLMKYILKKLQDEYYSVVPSEIGIKEPFKVEKDTIYIPPYPYVRDYLQKMSAYKGLDSDDVLNYCKRFLKFAQIVVPKNRLKLIEPFKRMLSSRKTVSDEIIDYASRRGFRKSEKTISNELAADIALHHSNRLLDEIISTRKILEKLP